MESLHCKSFYQRFTLVKLYASLLNLIRESILLASISVFHRFTWLELYASVYYLPFQERVVCYLLNLKREREGRRGAEREYFLASALISAIYYYLIIVKFNMLNFSNADTPSFC